MTLERISRINATIAVEVGWKYNEPDSDMLGKPWWILRDGKVKQRLLPPDYFNSLDAMHAAEKVLSPSQFESFRWILWDMCKHPLVSEWNRKFLSATASQRAEAFLKTLGLWEGIL